jgi:hypothetical protein
MRMANSTAQNDNEAAWTITRPHDTPADHEVVQRFVDALASTRAAGWLDEKPQNLSKWGLHKPQAVVVVNQDGETRTQRIRRTLRIGRKLQQGYAAQNSVSDAVFVLPNGAFALINRPLREWRSRRLARFDLAQLNSVAIRSAAFKSL